MRLPARVKIRFPATVLFIRRERRVEYPAADLQLGQRGAQFRSGLKPGRRPCLIELGQGVPASLGKLVDQELLQHVGIAGEGFGRALLAFFLGGPAGNVVIEHPSVAPDPDVRLIGRRIAQLGAYQSDRAFTLPQLHIGRRRQAIFAADRRQDRHHPAAVRQGASTSPGVLIDGVIPRVRLAGVMVEPNQAIHGTLYPATGGDDRLFAVVYFSLSRTE